MVDANQARPLVAPANSPGRQTSMPSTLTRPQFAPLRRDLRRTLLATNGLCTSCWAFAQQWADRDEHRRTPGTLYPLVRKARSCRH